MLLVNVIVERAVNNIKGSLDKKTNNFCLVFDNIFHE